MTATVKHLLLQLLEINIGQKSFYDSLHEAYRASMSDTHGHLETKMWSCLETGLATFQESNCTMILIDGLDELEGGERTAKLLCDRLASLAVRYPRIQIVTTSRHPPSKPDKGRTSSFEITPDHTHEDLRMVIDQCMDKYKYFHNRTEHARESLVAQLLHAAKGNFLWAVLTTVLLKRETSEDGFNKAFKGIKDATLSLEETINKFISLVDLNRDEHGLLLVLMLAARRPLSTAELMSLLHNKPVGKTKPSFLLALEPLIATRNGFVRFYTLRSSPKYAKSRTRVRGCHLSRLLRLKWPSVFYNT